MNKKGNIEILMLLCCLVGVVAFISFAMGAINLGAVIEQKMIPAPSILIEERDNLIKEKDQKEKEIARLEKEINELKRKIAEKENELANIRPSEKVMEWEKQKEELKRLKEQLAKLLKVMREKEEQLAKIRQILSVIEEKGKKDAKLKAELDKLKKQLEELNRKMKEKEAELKKIPIPIDDSLEKDRKRLRKAIKEAEKRKRELENKLARQREDKNKFNPWKDFKGTVSFSNPLFVECKDKFIMFHPEKKVLTISDMNKSNPFLNMSDGHDGIVFLVRPNGFEIFLSSFQLAKKTILPVAYEPIDSNWRLDFSKGGKQR